MSKKIEIIDNSLTVTDTASSDIDISQPSERMWYKESDLINGRISFYDLDGTDTVGGSFDPIALSDAVTSGLVAFTTATFRAFCVENLGGGGNAALLELQGSSIVPATDIEGNGISTIGTTAVVLAFTGKTRAILIGAGDTNTGRVYVGKSDVTSAGANAIAFLGAGESIELIYDDATNPIFVVGSIAAQEYFSGATLD